VEVTYCQAWGIENVVFGSDWLYCSPANYISYVKELLPLSDEEIEQLLSNDITTRGLAAAKSGTLTSKNF